MTSVVDRPAEERDGIDAAASGVTAAPPTKESAVVRMGRALGRQWPPILLFVFVLGGWELTMQLLSEPTRYFPAPSDAVGEVTGDLSFFWGHTQTTLKEAGLGFLIGSTLAGFFALLMAESSIADRALLPLFVVVKVTPAVVLAPFFVILLGFGMGPKVVLAVLTVFYSMLINALTGFKSIDEGALEVMQSVKASRLEIFWRLRLPNSLPYLFSAAKIGVPLAILGAVFAEIYNSTSGLGNIIRTAGEFGAFPAIWGTIYVLAAIGLILIGLVTLIERRLLRWHVSQRTA